MFGYIVLTFIFLDIYPNLACLSLIFSRINHYFLFFETLLEIIIELLSIIVKGLEVNGKEIARLIPSENFEIQYLKGSDSSIEQKEARV